MSNGTQLWEKQDQLSLQKSIYGICIMSEFVMSSKFSDTLLSNESFAFQPIDQFHRCERP